MLNTRTSPDSWFANTFKFLCFHLLNSAPYYVLLTLYPKLITKTQNTWVSAMPTSKSLSFVFPCMPLTCLDSLYIVWAWCRDSFSSHIALNVAHCLSIRGRHRFDYMSAACMAYYMWNPSKSANAMLLRTSSPSSADPRRL